LSFTYGKDQTFTLTKNLAMDFEPILFWSILDTFGGKKIWIWF